MFFLVLEAEAAYRLRRESPMDLHLDVNDSRRCDIHIETEYDSATSLPLPILSVRMRLEGDSLEEATLWGLNFVRGLLNNFGVASNSYVTDAQLVYAVDVSETTARRAFMQVQSRIVRNRPLSRTRLLDCDASLGLARAVMGADPATNNRLVRAVQQYIVALRYWTAETRVLSVAHAFIAAETLTPVAKKSLNLSDEELMQLEVREGHQKYHRRKGDHSRAAHSRARRVVVFHNDSATAKGARELSDGLEHGFEEFDTLIKLADIHGQKTLFHVRQSIVELSGLNNDLSAKIFDQRFAEPISLFGFVQVVGRLPENSTPEEAKNPPLDMRQIQGKIRKYDSATGEYQVDVTFGADLKSKVDVEIVHVVQ